MGQVSLEESTKKDLILLAKKLSIKGRSLMRKDQLIKSIKKALTANNEY